MMRNIQFTYQRSTQQSWGVKSKIELMSDEGKNAGDGDPMSNQPEQFLGMLLQ